MAVLRNAFPDGHLTLEDMVAEGDRVAARWTFQGTHRGQFMGIAATDKAVSISGIEIERFAGGRIVEHWEQADIMSLMQQLGAIPHRAKASVVFVTEMQSRRDL